MITLIVLLTAFVVSLFLTKLINKHFNLSFSGRIAMAVMLVFTAVGHFIYTEGMAMMIPHFIPFRTELVIMTGFLEILLALGLIIPNTSRRSGWTLIAFFVLVLPGNIYAAMNHVNYIDANTKGAGVEYLWFRIPLQAIFIVWTFLSSIKYNPAK